MAVSFGEGLAEPCSLRLSHHHHWPSCSLDDITHLQHTPHRTPPAHPPSQTSSTPPITHLQHTPPPHNVISLSLTDSQLCPSTPPPHPPDSYSNSVFSPGAASSFRDKSNSGGGPNGSILSNTVVQLRTREKSPQDGRVGRSYSISSSVRKSRNLDKNCMCVCVLMLLSNQNF